MTGKVQRGALSLSAQSNWSEMGITPPGACPEWSWAVSRASRPPLSVIRSVFDALLISKENTKPLQDAFGAVAITA